MTTTQIYYLHDKYTPEAKVRPWCLRWRTSSMLTSAYWYYSSRGEAERAATTLTKRSVQPTATAEEGRS